MSSPTQCGATTAKYQLKELIKALKQPDHFSETEQRDLHKLFEEASQEIHKHVRLEVKHLPTMTKSIGSPIPSTSSKNGSQIPQSLSTIDPHIKKPTINTMEPKDLNKFIKDYELYVARGGQEKADSCVTGTFYRMWKLRSGSSNPSDVLAFIKSITTPANTSQLIRAYEKLS
ncbi:hypothetical protein ADUPG1_000550, partial [Aduncisulcus paluster]